MWRLFGKQSVPPGPGAAAQEPEVQASSHEGAAPSAGQHAEPQAEPASAHALHPQRRIAEVDMVGRTAVATINVTELTQEQGAELLADLLYEMAETGAQHFVLDLTSVQYMDTACLGCLVQALNNLAARGGRIAIARANHSVHYVFRLTRLDRVFRICSDVMHALEAVEREDEAA